MKDPTREHLGGLGAGRGEKEEGEREGKEVT